jgi:hypothetical protein
VLQVLLLQLLSLELLQLLGLELLALQELGSRRLLAAAAGHQLAHALLLQQLNDVLLVLIHALHQRQPHHEHNHSSQRLMTHGDTLQTKAAQ